MEPKKRVTQEDIARACKIDQGSVSRILNEDTRDSFAEETVQKVFKVARELGYLHPSLITSNRRESSRRKAEVTGRVQVMIGTNTVYDEGEIDEGKLKGFKARCKLVRFSDNEDEFALAVKFDSLDEDAKDKLKNFVR